MDIVYSKDGMYIITAEKYEFDENGLTSEHITDTLCSALNIYSLPSHTVAEIHENAENLMIFARIPPSFYIFETFEDVISACTYCSAENASLYYYDDEYILSVPLPNTILDEFSDRLEYSQNLTEFLSEHGKLLIEYDAVNFVKNTF